MKLFRKALLFFIGAILFQSVLTFLLVTNITRRTNLDDAERELGEESSILYESFNSWKRQIWVSLIDIADTRGLSLRDVEDLGRSLREIRLSTKVDALVLKAPGGSLFIDQSTPGSFSMADLQELQNLKPHPYIELALVHGALSMVGVTTTSVRAAGSAAYLGADVFLVKRLDADFCTKMTLNRRSAVAILQGTTVLASSLPLVPAPSFFNPLQLKSAYMETYDKRVGHVSWNAAFQRLGRLDQAQEGDELFLATLLTNDTYDGRILLVSRSVLFVTVAGALLTLVLSLFLSLNITRPIADLLAGMGRIRDGVLDTHVPPRGGWEISRLFESFNDMARELKQNRAAVQEALAETVVLKEYNETIVNSIRAGIAIINSELVVEKANDSFLECFHLESARTIGFPLGSLGIDLVDDAMGERIRGIFRREREYHSEVKRAQTGRVYQVRLYPFYNAEGEFHEASRCVFMAEDISARTELEEKILQAEKLSTLSMLSAGMAHEINNPLGSILTNVQNLIDEEDDAERKVSLKWIEQETRRIARIVQELLNFASTQPARAAGTDVNAVVREVVGLVSHSFAREAGVRIDTRLSAGLPESVVRSDELRQVMINLLKNSLQAIQGPGRILVSTRLAAGGGRIALAVADTGVGIPPEIMPRIFDPFFTTKANGGGTGLGLSVVYGIVTKYEGSIDVKSGTGRGARFSLRLPTRGDEA
jgi:signal transduction histidine kinase